jgi:hypothetical protein
VPLPPERLQKPPRQPVALLLWLAGLLQGGRFMLPVWLLHMLLLAKQHPCCCSSSSKLLALAKQVLSLSRLGQLLRAIGRSCCSSCCVQAPLPLQHALHCPHVPCSDCAVSQRSSSPPT